MSGADDTARRCRTCGCTAGNCQQCIDRTGEPCFWVRADLCSACAPPEERSKAAGVGIANAAVEALSQLALLFQDAAIPPPGELGQVISRSIELFERLDLTDAPREELVRWAALAAICAGHAAQTLQACMVAIAYPDVGRRALAAVAPDPIKIGGQPALVTPSGAPVGGLVGLDGRPLTTHGGHHG